jgi:hypothetical protein
MTTLLTPVSLAALAQEALATAGLPTTAGSLTIWTNGRSASITFIGPGDGFAPGEARRLARALQVSDPQTSRTGGALRGLDPHQIDITIHQQAKAVAA